jgi:phosphodiesterase/alkaline phosphatase D-like protein
MIFAATTTFSAASSAVPFQNLNADLLHFHRLKAIQKTSPTARLKASPDTKQQIRNLPC